MSTFGAIGIEDYTIPTAGEYDITVDGAQGGSTFQNSSAAGVPGGAGAAVGGDVYLQGGDVLQIVVGGEGQPGAYAAGGGGGSYVIEIFNGSSSVDTILAIAGGGGGASSKGVGGEGQSGPTGAHGGGGGGFTGGAGAGLGANGGAGHVVTGGTFGGGAPSGVSAGTGGFGGGGGGGYTGGGGGYTGGGGRSFFNGTATTDATGGAAAENSANSGNGQVEVPDVTYWHVELESHDVLLAEGLPCESYMDAGNRAFFGREYGRLETIDPERVAESLTRYARPFVDQGPIVEAIRERLRARAATLGKAAEQRRAA